MNTENLKLNNRLILAEPQLLRYTLSVDVRCAIRIATLIMKER